MKLFPSLQKRYAKERFTAVQAQRLAQEIAFWPRRISGLTLDAEIRYFPPAIR